MKKIYSAILAYIILVAMVSGCLSGTTPTEKARYVDVSFQQGKEMIDSGEVFILDVRTKEEYDEDHIMGSTLIPVEERRI